MNVKRLLMLIIAVLLPTIAFAQSNDLAYMQRTNEAANLCNQALHLMNNQDYAQALDVLNKACLLDPNRNSANIHTNLGGSFRGTGKLDQSIAEYTKALEFDPNSLSARRGLANSLCARGIELYKAQQYDQAKPMFEQALAIKDVPASDLANFHIGYGRLYQEMGNYEEAINQNKIALDCAPQSKNALRNLGVCYEHVGDIDQAKHYLAKYAQDFPNEPNRNLVLATLDELDHAKISIDEDKNSSDYLTAAMIEGGEIWPKNTMPLKVYIPSQADLPGFRNSFVEILKDSFDQWANAANNYLSWRMTSNSKEADIVCCWTNSSKDLRNQSIEQGLTIRECRGPKNSVRMITHVQIILSIIDPMSGQILSDKVMNSLCLHEIGHALGIMGHSSCNNDAMFFSTGPTHTQHNPSPRDITTINRLYKTCRAKPVGQDK